jgi:hypothetical protein
VRIDGSISSSSNTRSQAVIADCMTAYLVEKSRIGMKNLFMYSMKATSVPKPIAPETVADAESGSSTIKWAPYQRMSAIVMLLMPSTIEKSAAS